MGSGRNQTGRGEAEAVDDAARAVVVASERLLLGALRSGRLPPDLSAKVLAALIRSGVNTRTGVSDG